MMSHLENIVSKNIGSTSSDLADFIKETHKSLRTMFKENKDMSADSLWTKHTQDKNHLNKYAQAMYTLATEHWENKKNVSRIQWIHDSVSDYFFQGGLEQRTEKEKRKVSFTRENELCTFQKVRNTLPKYDSSRRLKVLDVGSCYNPFGHYEDMDVTPIDLHPAKTGVFSCDFLSLEVVEDGDDDEAERNEKKGRKRLKASGEAAADPQNTKRLRASGEDRDHDLGTECDDISKLKASSFDAVIFCLFLEYIPCPRLRFQCCQKAYELLKPNGVLCIVTPDSKHDGANIHLFKMWKITLNNLGFDRINYHKSAHFHGMLFRRGLIPSVWQDDSIRELEEIKNKKLSAKFTGINYESILKSIFIVQDIEDLKDQTCPKKS